MLNLLAAVGGGAFVLASLVIGGRLLWVGLRGRRLPELSIGAGLFFSGGIGYPMVGVAQQLPDLDPTMQAALVAGHMGCNVVGMGALAAFTYRVFRPGARWALAAVCAFLAVEIAAGLLQLLGPGGAAFAETRTGPWAVNVYAAMAVLIWSATESLVQCRMLRRRATLGLADPVVANRMLLWAVSMYTAATMSLLSVLLEALGIAEMGSAGMSAVIGPLGLAASLCLALAFWPPRAYLRWLQADPLPSP